MCVCNVVVAVVVVVYQLIPRTVELHPSGKQLIQWPIEELEALRGNDFEMSNVEIETGDMIEIKDITSAQVLLCIIH